MELKNFTKAFCKIKAIETIVCDIQWPKNAIEFTTEGACSLFCFKSGAIRERGLNTVFTIFKEGMS